MAFPQHKNARSIGLPPSKVLPPPTIIPPKPSLTLPRHGLRPIIEQRGRHTRRQTLRYGLTRVGYSSIRLLHIKIVHIYQRIFLPKRLAEVQCGFLRLAFTFILGRLPGVPPGSTPEIVLLLLLVAILSEFDTVVSVTKVVLPIFVIRVHVVGRILPLGVTLLFGVLERSPGIVPRFASVNRPCSFPVPLSCRCTRSPPGFPYPAPAKSLVLWSHDGGQWRRLVLLLQRRKGHLLLRNDLTQSGSCPLS